MQRIEHLAQGEIPVMVCDELPSKEYAVEGAIYIVHNIAYVFTNNEFEIYSKPCSPYYTLYNDLCSFITEVHKLDNIDNKDILNIVIALKNIVETYLENKGEL